MLNYYSISFLKVKIDAAEAKISIFSIFIVTSMGETLKKKKDYTTPIMQIHFITN